MCRLEKNQGRLKRYQAMQKVQTEMEHLVLGSMIPPRALDAGWDSCSTLKLLRCGNRKSFGKMAQWACIFMAQWPERKLWGQYGEDSAMWLGHHVKEVKVGKEDTVTSAPSSSWQMMAGQLVLGPSPGEGLLEVGKCGQTTGLGSLHCSTDLCSNPRAFGDTETHRDTHNATGTQHMNVRWQHGLMQTDQVWGQFEAEFKYSQSHNLLAVHTYSGFLNSVSFLNMKYSSCEV